MLLTFSLLKIGIKLCVFMIINFIYHFLFIFSSPMTKFRLRRPGVELRDTAALAAPSTPRVAGLAATEALAP